MPPKKRLERLAVFAGRLIGWKGARIAVAALCERSARDWHLEVFGDGPDRPALERLAQRVGVADRVTFRGWRGRREVMTWLRRAHCLVHPAILDAAPSAVAEAVSLGTPVVCFDRLGPAELARDRGGLLVQPGRDAPRRFADAMAAAPLGVEPNPAWLAERVPVLLNQVYEEAVAVKTLKRERRSAKYSRRSME